MNLQRFLPALLCACLLLALSGCGNKGPLVLPEEDEQQQKKNRSSSSY